MRTQIAELRVYGDMPFADFLFMMPTKITRLRVHLTSDVFYCLWRGDAGEDEEAIARANLPFLQEIAADKIEASGFRPGIVTITAMDIER